VVPGLRPDPSCPDRRIGKGKACGAARRGKPESQPSGRAGAGQPGDFWLATFALEAWEWEIDHDGDGYTARQEYASGTSPFEAGSVLGLAIGYPDGEVVASWQSVAGAVY
jgi:hypothetical protein